MTESVIVRALLDELAADPQALERLRQLVAPPEPSASTTTRVYTPRTLADELGRTPRSVRDAIHRRELRAVKRGRGWIIGADAVADWTRGDPPGPGGRRRRTSRLGRATSRSAWGLK